MPDTARASPNRRRNAFNNRNLEGTLIAASVSGNGEFHHYPFGGNLPAPPPSGSNSSGGSSEQANNSGETSQSGSSSNSSGGSSEQANNPGETSQPKSDAPPSESGSEVAAVPEPTTIAGAIVGGGILSLLRRKKARSTDKN